MKQKQTQNNAQNEVEMAYVKPSIEVIEMEMEHPILASSGDGTGNGFGSGGGWEN